MAKKDSPKRGPLASQPGPAGQDGGELSGAAPVVAPLAPPASAEPVPFEAQYAAEIRSRVALANGALSHRDAVEVVRAQVAHDATLAAAPQS